MNLLSLDALGANKSIAILLGVGGAGIAAAIGYGIYSSQKRTSIVHSETFQSRAMCTNTQPATGCMNHISSNWKSKYEVKYIQVVEQVLFNSVDALSVYGHANEDVFLDLVHFVDQFCLLYLNSQRYPQDPTWITISSKLQIRIFNAINQLEAKVQNNYPKGQQQKILRDFGERSQMIVNIINSFHQNIIRQSNTK